MCQAADAVSGRQAAEYAAQVSKTIVELQQFRHTDTTQIETAGDKKAVATLMNLNPAINAWYLLWLSWPGEALKTAYHLENGDPIRQRLLLDEAHPYGLVIATATQTQACDLWAGAAQDSLAAARRSNRTYVPLCNGKLYLRNPIKGHRTVLETATDFLRDNLWGGEKLVGFVRDTLLHDAHVERGKLSATAPSATEDVSQTQMHDAPAPAAIAQQYSERTVMPGNLGINIEPPLKNGLLLGRWYRARDNPGVYVSVIQPLSIMPEILQSYATVVNSLDSVEAAALVYLVAFNLGQFDLGFALGTDHPRLGWSGRVLGAVRDKALPGPDGIDSPAPLVATGLISPPYAPRTVATFTAGFKRYHGAFKYGELALQNHGSHYGFIEQGVVFSKLQPGLSTIVTLNDGSLLMKTWTEGDNKQLARIKHARQNGVPLIERDATAQVSVPGPLVSRWGPGNWSGSQDMQLRTLRAGACLQERQEQRFLMYGYFSSATPSAMARVFQAYGCRYAMLLDMNALEHTYMALYRRQGQQLVVQHLIEGMKAFDKSLSEQYVPRFLGYADNRDFFYVMRRERREVRP